MILCLRCWLAIGAEVSAPVTHRYSFEGGAAYRAGLAALMGNLKLKVCRTPCAIGAEVGIRAGPFIADSRPQHLRNGTMNALYLLPGQAVG